MTQTLSEETARKTHNKLLEIDQFAKTLGFKIFRIDCEFQTDCEPQILSTTALNQPSEEYLDYIDKHFNR